MGMNVRRVAQKAVGFRLSAAVKKVDVGSMEVAGAARWRDAGRRASPPYGVRPIGVSAASTTTKLTAQATTTPSGAHAWTTFAAAGSILRRMTAGGAATTSASTRAAPSEFKAVARLTRNEDIHSDARAVALGI